MYHIFIDSTCRSRKNLSLIGDPVTDKMSRRSKKRKEEDEEQKPVVCEGEQDNLFSEVMREEIGTMWEVICYISVLLSKMMAYLLSMLFQIPQIFQFLHLTKESLNIPHFSIYEMERMLLIPRASKQLANIMTCLLRFLY